jgi:uracil-DNA glycosylase family protein
MNQQLGLFDSPTGVESFNSIDEAREAARGCVRCDLANTRRQVVFGEGMVAPRLMIVGEGPSEADDASGHPFSGPSGKLLERWLGELGLGRDAVWLTNVVRCRPTQLEGSRLRNRPPRSAEIQACRLWMDTERTLVRPALILCVGATAGRALLGRDFKMTRDRGRWLATADGTPTLATYNPAYVLRLEDAAREQAEAEVAADLASIRDRLGPSASA